MNDVQQKIIDSLTRINEMKSEDEDKMDTVVLNHTLKKKPSNKKKILEIDGIQSTCRVTYNRDTNSIKNNVYPDCDRKKGVPVEMKSTSIDRAKKETSRYGPFREKEADPGVMKNQEKKRQKWLKNKEYLK